MYFINRNLSQKLNLTGKINAHKVKIFKIHCYEFHFFFFEREREQISNNYLHMIVKVNICNTDMTKKNVCIL